MFLAVVSKFAFLFIVHLYGQPTAPVLENMASNNLDVTFIGVDSEASPENKATFVQKGIQAMPTFHFYVNGTVMYEVKGAREDAIEEGMLSVPRSTAP